MCTQVGQHTDLPEETTELLWCAVGHARVNRAVWRVRGAWCPNCEAPYLTIWPHGLSLEDRRALVAERSAPLAIAGEGGDK
jgi:hypothetical protein